MNYAGKLYRRDAGTGASKDVKIARTWAPEILKYGNGAEAQDRRATRAHLLNYNLPWSFDRPEPERNDIRFISSLII